MMNYKYRFLQLLPHFRGHASILHDVQMTFMPMWAWDRLDPGNDLETEFGPGVDGWPPEEGWPGRINVDITGLP